MVGTDEGVAVVVAGAEAHTGTAAMKSEGMVVIVIAAGMMTGTWSTAMRVDPVPGGTGAQVQFIGENAAGALKVRDTIVQLEKAVKKGVPKLSNGTGKRN